MQIRAATETDIAEIQSIYAHHVLTGAGTFEEIPPRFVRRCDRFAAAHAPAGKPMSSQHPAHHCLPVGAHACDRAPRVQA